MRPGEIDTIPDVSRLAGLLADPARARMLCLLMTGRALTATELARAASLSPQAASHHLARMLDARVLAMLPQGRHRYYRLASPEFAHAVEALTAAARASDEQAPHFVPSTPEPLRAARSCYNHLAGRLGVALFEAMLQQGLYAWTGPARAEVTPQGWRWLHESLGIPEHGACSGGVRACLDWSERRSHAAGPCATAMLQALLERGWLRRGAGRQLLLTPPGRAGLRAVLPSLQLE
ncbi:ArsR/SmtB family transcription factor [Ramlibacter alkalitolerans]|uniref:Helix-turn-helix transcriptional regulator n=1 Tax=Ramlibacter alkalitolerans TaxID=2039631 RepID=A0ABS1JRQ1_9BURK|nr:helix-turn-helix transcriptional regulator [Ramlibacter alkalitolerans]MBL0426954.1 helix-turn-helix transcriptional regulator [Ramlibacter alkalitolerans]